GALVIHGFATLPLRSQGKDGASTTAMLGGTITSASSEKMEGVMVSTRAVGASFTTSVLTDAQGEYIFPPLPSGTYKLWAQAVGYEAGRADVTVKGGAYLQQNFALKTLANFEAQLTGSEWMASLPEDTPENRKMKEVFRYACNGCHTQNFSLLTR